jgi:hypothetical protein
MLLHFAGCPLWVTSCHATQSEAWLLYLRKLPRLSPTGAAARGISGLMRRSKRHNNPIASLGATRDVGGDNQCTQHYAIWDYWPNVRSGYRMIVTGSERPLAA